MIKEIIKRIKNNESRVEKNIEKARREEKKRIEKAHSEIEKEWGNVHDQLREIRKDILNAQIAQTEKEAQEIKKGAARKKKDLEKLQPKTKKIAREIVKEIF